MNQDLIKEYCDDFRARLEDPDTAAVIRDEYIPIIWFGDLNKYAAQTFKIITIALNPSSAEFTSLRFNHQKDIRNNINNGVFPVNLEADLNNYFNVNPYWKWFNHFERKLQQLGASYTNGVIHMDLYSAIPTNPVWGGLSSSVKNTIKRPDLALKLINELNPDLILVSCRKAYFEDVFTGAIPVVGGNFTTASNRKLELYDWNGRKVLFGSNNRGCPFQTVQITPEVYDLIHSESNN